MVAVDPHTGQVLDQSVAPGRLVRLRHRHPRHAADRRSRRPADRDRRRLRRRAGASPGSISGGRATARACAGALVPDFARARPRPCGSRCTARSGFWISAILLVSSCYPGSSWSGIWGEQASSRPGAPSRPKNGTMSLSRTPPTLRMNHGAAKEVPVGAGADAACPPRVPRPARTGVPAGTAVDIDAMAALAPRARYCRALPAGDCRTAIPGCWTISPGLDEHDTPTRPRPDRASSTGIPAAILADVRFADYSLGGKAMAVGIAFHEGDLGAWNVGAQHRLLPFGDLPRGQRLGRCGGSAGPPTPGAWSHRRASRELPLWKGAVVLGLFLCLAFPLVGITLLAVLAFDMLVVQNIPRLERALS